MNSYLGQALAVVVAAGSRPGARSASGWAVSLKQRHKNWVSEATTYKLDL